MAQPFWPTARNSELAATNSGIRSAKREHSRARGEQVLLGQLVGVELVLEVSVDHDRQPATETSETEDADQHGASRAGGRSQSSLEQRATLFRSRDDARFEPRTCRLWLHISDCTDMALSATSKPGVQDVEPTFVRQDRCQHPVLQAYRVRGQQGPAQMQRDVSPRVRSVQRCPRQSLAARLACRPSRLRSRVWGRGYDGRSARSSTAPQTGPSAPG